MRKDGRDFPWRIKIRAYNIFFVRAYDRILAKK